MGNELKYFKTALDGYLKERGKSQSWLAHKAKITQQTINNLVKGSFGKEDTRDKLLAFIGMDFISFLEYGRAIYNHEQGIEPAPKQEIEPPVTVNSITPKLQTLSQSDLAIVDTLVDRLSKVE